MKRNYRKLRPVTKISSEHKTYVSFRGKLVHQKIPQEVFIASILLALTKFLNEVIWRTKGKQAHKQYQLASWEYFFKT